MSTRKLTRVTGASKISSEFPTSQTGSQMSTNVPKEAMHTYDAVAQPTVVHNTGLNEQQHIYDRTQHPGIGDKTQQTRDECNQGNTTDRGQYEHVDNTIDKEAETRKQGPRDMIMIQSQSQRKKSNMGHKLCLPRRTFTTSWRAQ